uniref:Uncharacterized protein n=1 Tax=Plectus sambesii TaxID=2011161 RepID=A0A914VZS1_9BILA
MHHQPAVVATCLQLFALIISQARSALGTPGAKVERSALRQQTGIGLPNSENGTVPVYVGYYVESLGNFKATEMAFDMDIYLHLSWQDDRLIHSDPEPKVINDMLSIRNIWLPDLYFANAKRAQFQTVTVPNFVAYIESDGTVAYSTRVILNIACNLDLKDYPLDSQECYVKILSYAHIRRQMMVMWLSNQPIKYNHDIDLPEFSVQNMSTDYCGGVYSYAITERGHKRDEFSCLLGKITLTRAIGYHLVQTYIPTGLIVAISWVSFWIDRNAVPARVSLSFTTLLTLSTMSAGLRFALPAVSYAKAIDYWVGLCMLFVFGALLEFAVVNNLMRRAKKCTLQANARTFGAF